MAKETPNELFQRVLSELRAIASDPAESTERRVKAQHAINDLTRGSHVSPSVNSVNKDSDGH